MSQKKIILVDSNAVMHRAYHAMPPLTTKKGELVNMVYGFTSVILKVINEIKPDYVACAFDVSGGTFRDEIFEDYKAGRKKPDQEFYDQIDRVKEVLGVMNIPIYEKRGFEADDIIGTIASIVESKKEDIEIIIVTGDMDAMQLVNDKVKVYALRKGISDTFIYDEGSVFDKYGIKPDQVVDYKAIRGDDSDNIPGVKGVGEKGAKKLLENFNDLENIYKKLEKDSKLEGINPRVIKNLLEQKKEAFMSKKLATIKKDVAIKFDLKDCLWGDYDENKIDTLFRELEFFSLISRLNKSGELSNNIKKRSSFSIKYHLVKTTKEFDSLAKLIKEKKKFVFKTKEEDHKIACKNLTGLIFIFENKEFFEVPVEKEKKQTLFEEKTDQNFLLDLKKYLEDENIKKIGFDLKSDMENLAAYDISLKGLDFDVMLAAYLLDPGKRDYAVEKILFDNIENFSSCTFSKNNNIENEEEMSRLFHLFEVKKCFSDKMKETEMYDLFVDIEMPLISVLCRIEMTGVNLDCDLLGKISIDFDEQINALSREIHSISGDDVFNINSSKQLAVVLFEKMKLPVDDIKKGKTGYSVAASELEKLRSKSEIIDLISKYRELTKLKNTYIDALPKLINSKTGRLHTTFNQIVTATGRLSSSDPNLQNIPVRTEEGRKIRKAFIVDDGRTMISADYSQIELRIIATISKDEKMQEIFNKGLDIHAATAAEINQVELSDVTYEMRRAAKAINFGVIYGMSVFGFSQSVGVDVSEAKKFIDSYMKRFSSVATYLEESKKSAFDKGYAETLWGRRRYLPELKSSNSFLKSSAERMAVNMPIQGTAADLMKINMLKVDEWVEDYNLKKGGDVVKVLLQVHDELVFSVKNDFVSEVETCIKDIMENGHIKFDGRNIDFSVPIKVDIEKGKNWEEME